MKSVSTIFTKDGESQEFTPKEMVTAKNLGQCDDEIYLKGSGVAMATGASSSFIERFVREVAEISEQPVDWFYAGGRSVIKTTGDKQKVISAIRAIKIEVNIYE